MRQRNDAPRNGPGTQARQRLGFRCWGIAVSMGVTPSLQSVCDQVAEVSQFANGADVKAIFTNVTSR
jgi:hypothetical protein